MAKTLDTTPQGFDNLLNFRDVAVSINNQQHHTVLRQGQLYRSARPDSASSSDRQQLRDVYGIKTIVDLRSKTEHIEAAKKHTELAKATQPAFVPVTNNYVAQALKIPGIRYADINLNGKGFERHLIWQLSYSNLAWLVGYMSLGYRLQGISIIGKNVLQPRGLIGLGKDTLKHSGPEIKEVFDVLANPESYPVLVHCTQGKDRTGLIVTLVLLLCGVDIDAISDDYRMSEAELKPEFEDRMKEIASIGLDESFAGCPKSFVCDIAQFIQEEFGGVERYLSSIGVQQQQISQIRKQFRA